MDIQQKYSELLEKIGFDETIIAEQWIALQKAYSKKSRHYHNLNHIQEMITEFDINYAELKSPNEVLYAIFYHDVIYKATSKENELKSAEYAISILPAKANIDKNLVYDMILATKLHQHNAVEDINWLIDFDLKILAKDWADYTIYFEQIRKEYHIYPDFMYKPGRKKALEHFLENEFIYQTEIYRIGYEKQARENIQREIDLLH